MKLEEEKKRGEIQKEPSVKKSPSFPMRGSEAGRQKRQVKQWEEVGRRARRTIRPAARPQCRQGC